jgi:vacuolar protein sorting-associated protein IST1
VHHNSNFFYCFVPLLQNIAELLRQGKEEIARVKVEAVIRDDMMLQAFEIIDLFLELILSRIGMLKMQAGVPFDLKEVGSCFSFLTTTTELKTMQKQQFVHTKQAICTIIYCAPRLEAPELLEVRSQFILKYGKPFASEAMENKGHCVNEKVIHKVGVCFKWLIDV